MINEWLQAFKTSWITKNINEVIGLFTDDVAYWETPYQHIQNKKALTQEWKAIQKQQDITLDLEVFSSKNNRHTVLWRLSYTNEAAETKHWAGTYLIELDSSGRCSYFHQTGEAQ